MVYQYKYIFKSPHQSYVCFKGYLRSKVKISGFLDFFENGKIYIKKNQILQIYIIFRKRYALSKKEHQTKFADLTIIYINVLNLFQEKPREKMRRVYYLTGCVIFRITIFDEWYLFVKKYENHFY